MINNSLNFSDLNIPITLSHLQDFRTQVSNKLAAYIAFITPSIDDLKRRNIISNETHYIAIDKIESSETVINDLFTSFDNGDRLKCYNLLRDLMTIYDGNINDANFTYSVPKNSEFYRIRPDRIIDGKHNHNIFHIPFKLRHLVTNLRFNPPGIPCLYCSSDLQTASGEFDNKFKLYDSINDPANSKNDALNVGIFLNSRELSCLDFSLRDIKHLHDNVTSNSKAFLNYAIVYPLMMLLHCKQDFTLGQSVAFRMEYMLPSFMMTWIFNQIGEGFKYFSGKSVEAFKYSSVKSDTPLLSHNYVFPSFYKCDSDYCSVLESVFLKKYTYVYTDELRSHLAKESVDDSDYHIIQDYVLGKLRY